MESLPNNLSRDEENVARQEARAFLRGHRWLERKGYDLEDLVQEAVLKWLRVRPRYVRRGGASWKTYMKRVVRNHFADLVDEQKAQMRGGRSSPPSLDAPVAADAEGETWMDMIPDEDAESRTYAALDDQDRAEALSRACSRLTDAQREICRMLGAETSISQISRITGRRRSTLYDDIARIRAVFEDAGLREFLP